MLNLLLLALAPAQAAILQVCNDDVTVGGVAVQGCVSLEAALNGANAGDELYLYASANPYVASATVTQDLWIIGKNSDQGARPTWQRPGEASFALGASCVDCEVRADNLVFDVVGGAATQAVGEGTYLVLEDVDLIDSTGTTVGNAALVFANAAEVKLIRVAASGLSASGTFLEADAGAVVWLEDASFTGLSGENGALVRVLGASSVRVIGGVFTDCLTHGSGLFQATDGGRLWLDGARVVNADAAISGGVVYAQNAGMVHLEGVVVDGSNAGSLGGVLASYSSPLVIAGSVLEGGSSTSGGILYVDGGSLHVRDSDLRDGVTRTVGQGAIAQLKNLTLARFERTLLDDTDANDEGRLVYAEETVGELRFDAGEVRGARSGGFYGGGVYTGAATLTVSGTRFTNNEGAAGGAIYALSPSVSVQDAYFEGNGSDTWYGGAVALASTSAAGITVDRCQFVANDSLSAGGALAIVTTGEAQVSRSRFVENGAADGGALIVDGTRLTVEQNLFCGNLATNHGGAIKRLESADGSLLRQSVFIENQAATYGGAVYWSGALGIEHNTFAYNGGEQDIAGSALVVFPPVAGGEIVANAVGWHTAGSAIANSGVNGASPTVAYTHTFANATDYFGAFTMGAGNSGFVDLGLSGISGDGDCTNDDWTPDAGSGLTGAAADGSDVGATGLGGFETGVFEGCNGLDDDGDGTIDEGFSDADSDGIADCVDVEECDDVDHDGDGAVDEGFVDFDGSGTPDCREVEVCDGADNDNDGAVDEGVLLTFFVDDDNDGYAGTAVFQCTADGASATLEDCDDGDALISPEALELCDTVDQDCDGSIDEGVTKLWYLDEDGDGYAGSEFYACEQPAGSSTTIDDCDDTQELVHPGADEYCDGLDSDCDDLIDEDPVDGDIGYADRDGDGFAGGEEVLTCDGASVADDCDDDDPGIHPLAYDRPNDGIDQDCDDADAASVVGGACGCQTQGPAGWLAWVLVPLLARRRRS
ncbi:MAG: hypothetical protein EP330_13570 [Deltaproteobacteria bacterium]|nr:MAG: hypothetical protein EP330_13570 [Deltaproteobacteria bacterium]